MITMKCENLKPAPWRVTHVLRPDLRVLAQSMIDYGWLSPIVVRQADGMIIDGFHRWFLADTNTKLVKKFDREVPVITLDVDEIDAMVAHLRMNRARSFMIPKYMSVLLGEVMVSGKYDDRAIKSMLRMSSEEFDLLSQPSLLKSMNISEHEYSKAWVPIESNGNDVPVFERPPNPDR